MNRILAVTCVLLAACGATQVRTLSRNVSVTFSAQGNSYMSKEGDGVDREVRIDDGVLSIRFENSGVSLDLSEFPGEKITQYFDELEAPLEFKLPDGTRFVYHGDSFEVDGETYELEPDSGMSSFLRDGLLINP